MKLLPVCLFVASLTSASADPLEWPEVTAEAKPWTRWWWLGSAVDEANLTRELEAFSKAGLGGVEICPIYGAKGAEDRFLKFLSPEWMKSLAHTTREAERVGMKVDLTTGTGWPFGGANVGKEHASSGLKRIKREVKGGREVEWTLPEGRFIVLIAKQGDKTVDLAHHVKDGGLKWEAPAGDWKLLGLTSPEAIQKVKRAAPGGEGSVLDPFSADAMETYLADFDEAFKGFTAPKPRAHFHDSFEYYGAEWTPRLPEEFRKQHGYDLFDELAAFLGEADEDRAARVRADYRATLDRLHHGYLSRWHSWANGNDAVTRNQAHGSPGNLLDHYAISEIPETEIFRHVDEDQIPMLQFASSATHVTGRTLTSAESFTWLGEHFQVTPEKLKDAVDFLFLGGVNHVFYHGIPYTPEDAGWPGWLFYASTHMGPNGGLWRDIGSFNGYITRVQSVLQSGSPSPDALLYFPAHDLFHQAPGNLPLYTLHDQHNWLQSLPFYDTAMSLWKSGVVCDFVSDSLLEGATVENGAIKLGGNAYPVLILPAVKRIPHTTLRKIHALAESGATILFQDAIPADVPGFGKLDERREELAGISAELGKLRNGKVHVISNGLPDFLRKQGVTPERMGELGLRFVRRRHDEGHHYFISNRSTETVSATVPIGREMASAVLLDPRRPERVGLAEIADGEHGKGVALSLAPGESVIVRTFDKTIVEGPVFPSLQPQGEPLVLSGEWSLEFIEGGPELPEPVTVSQLGSWTETEDTKTLNFSGTGRYKLSFKAEAGPKILDLGKVAGTARVSLNGRDLGASWSVPHVFDVSSALVDGENTLEVEVTNLAANRIADLDRRGVPWKNFHEINFVNIEYKPFDASGWKPLDSGLLGPVTLTPLKRRSGSEE